MPSVEKDITEDFENFDRDDLARSAAEAVVFNDPDIDMSFEDAMANAYKPELPSDFSDVVKAVNPRHYKDHLPASEVPYQWAQTHWFKARKAAERLLKALGLNQTEEYLSKCQLAFYVEFMRAQADKYHSRFGLKDVDVQELQKTQWYLKAAELAYTGPFHNNGMPYLPDEV